MDSPEKFDLVRRETRLQRKSRWLVWAGAGASLLLSLLCLALFLPRLVTWRALEDAGQVVKFLARNQAPNLENLFVFHLFRKDALDQACDKEVIALAKKYALFFRAGCLDPDYLIERVPAAGFTPEAWPVLLVVQAYGEAREEAHLNDDPPAVCRELLNWIRPVLASSRAKEALVNLLIDDYEFLPGRKEPAGPVKNILLIGLTFREADDYSKGKEAIVELQRITDLVLPQIEETCWRAVLRDCRHPREKVRAGALLLLCHHPSLPVFTDLARAALEDPAELVRLAAAGALAYHGDGSGEAQLVKGLEHPRWEVRWWCGKSLAYLERGGSKRAIAGALQREPDGWVKGEMEKMLAALK